MEGQIIKISSNRHIVEANNNTYPCIPRGKFRKDKVMPRVGDYVIFDPKKLVIEEIKTRKNVFDRPLVSNIDQAFIVTSLVHPDFQENLLDRLLVLMELHHVDSVICLTKKDITSSNTFLGVELVLAYYKKIGYPVLLNTDLLEIKDKLKNKTSVFVGQTGAGKSTLLNKLNEDWNLKTGEVSIALGRGRHTTRNVELYNFLGGKVLDTPGFSALDFTKYKKEDIKDAFVEFNNYTCPFKDCSHTREKECLIRKAVRDGEILESRYNNYIRFYEEAK